VVEAKWAGSQSNHGTWTNGYNFCPSGMRSILTINIKAKVASSIPSGQLLRGRLLWVTQLSYSKGQVG